MADYVERQLESKLVDMAQWFPIVAITGPRQSGKSTLARHAFPQYDYVNLEDPQIRASALEDPVSFIRNRPDHLIIDEAQYAPDLFSMIQVASDERNTPGQYILTGSQNFHMMQHIGQSLAGRVGLLKLLPFSYQELWESSLTSKDTDPFTLRGGYPRLYSASIPLDIYFQSYIETYIERDVAGLLGVRDRTAFRKLLYACAHLAGRLVNISSLANDIDVSTATIRSWLSMLESSYLIFFQQPYHANLKKRLTKKPKLYFYDTGLLCHLLHIETTGELVSHALFGEIFENLIIAETAKCSFNTAKTPELYFYRDDSKREVDLLDYTLSRPQAAEIKSSRTYHAKYATQLTSVCNDLSIDEQDRFVIARVEDTYHTDNCTVSSAHDWLVRQSLE